MFSSFPRTVMVVLALWALASGAVASQPNCETAERIESNNRSVFDKRVAHVKGLNARLFLALAPIWSTPDFENVPYRHPKDMEMIKKQFEHLMELGIDEIIVWNFRQGGIAVAVPFKDGCAVSGYGEPDLPEKLFIMHETLLLISKHGLGDSSVRDGIKRLLMVGRFARHFDDEMIDIIIDKLRPLMATD